MLQQDLGKLIHLSLVALITAYCVQVVGGKITQSGRLGAFITKVKKGSLADVVGHLRAGNRFTHCFQPRIIFT